jgi:hypothetical protein
VKFIFLLLLVRSEFEVVTLSEALKNYINSDSQIIGGGVNMFGEEYVNGIPTTGNEKLDDFLKGKVKGIINAPIYDREYFKVGDVVRVTPSEKLQYKVSGWQSRPATPFNAIIIDVIPEKLMIVYYSPSTRKLCGRYAIPAEWVNDGFIKIDKIMGA